jgi:hypothetical protein
VIIIPPPRRPGDPPPPPFRVEVRYALLVGLAILAGIGAAMWLGGTPLH